MSKHRLAVALAAVTAVCAALAATAVAGRGGHTMLYEFRGELTAASSTSVGLTVEGGNHAALKALIGGSQSETFALDSSTRVLVGSTPQTGGVGNLHVGDAVTVRVRAARGASLATIVGTPAAQVVDHAGAAHASGPLFLYVGTVSGAQPSDHVALHVTGGNWRGLKSMLGQPLDQSFATGSSTIYVLWQGGRPTVIQPSEMKAGDRITVRVHAPVSSTLAQVEATAAARVGDHEPGNPESEN